MKKSIETIWKEGFLKNDALVAPKLNDLYSQKSESVVGKLMSMSKINLIIIMIVATGILIGFTFIGATYVGIALFLLLSLITFIAKKQGDEVMDIDNTLSSYQYLKAVDGLLKNIIIKNIRINSFFYPAFILTLMLGIWFTDYGSYMLNKLTTEVPDLHIVFGIPTAWLVSIVIVAVLASVFAGPIYRFDIKTTYGRVFRKLDEIIKDMEELRA